MSSSELRDYATAVAATAALRVFIVHVVSQLRNRRIENIARFDNVHQRLIASSLGHFDVADYQRQLNANNGGR